MGDGSRLRVSIQTFGCRVNQYESDVMRSRLLPEFELTADDPDIVILNACTVTALAERKARQAARRMRRLHPSALVVVIGCLADAVEQGTTQFPDADLLAGNSWKPRIAEVIVQTLAGARGTLSPTPLHSLSDERSRGPKERIRAFLKIQDGCSRACTYCRTTQVRGAPRSKPIAAVVEEAIRLLHTGYPEIVLTGIDLAQYSPPGEDLGDAVREVASLSGLRRLRLASINPSGITEKLVGLCADHEVISPHFHIPLQSGDSRVLAAMERGYDIQMYLAAIARIRTRMPHATFGTDIIVGFPGEDDDAFAHTCQIADAVGFVNTHVFRYSPRRGTQAAELPHQVPPEVKRHRSESLILQWEKGLGKALDNRIGSTQHVLVEERRDHRWHGYTHDYLTVKFSSDRHIPIGSIVPVRLTGRIGATLEGVDDHRINAC
jgi:threonylcarbamoyladenosine tRNA methylthiotransferase MtaB